MRVIAELPSVHYVEQIKAVRRDVDGTTWLELHFYGPDCEEYQALKLPVFFGEYVPETTISRLVQAINQVMIKETA